MKYCFYLLIICSLTLTSCFRDKGNYDYTDINEIVIGEKGFSPDTVYNIRANINKLTITPELSFSTDPEEKGAYKYEWVAVGTQKYPGERFVIGTERNLDCIITLPAEAFMLYLKITDPRILLFNLIVCHLIFRSLIEKHWCQKQSKRKD